MRSLVYFVLCVVPFVALGQQPPVTAKKPHETTIHGDVLSDEYFWLRDKKNAEVVAHLEAENAYTDAVMKPTEALQQKIYEDTGRSAGGLLIGAAMTMRPDLFKAVVASSPFVDILNTMMDPTLPLTTSEYVEWGNPTVEKDYRYVTSYSPYDNIRRSAYPATLVEVSPNDSQVGFWEGTKFVARLRDANTSRNPLLLRVNMGGGHAGSSGRYDGWRQLAFAHAFTLWQVGITK